MWPWGHLAAGYLVYTFYARVRHHQPPRDGPAFALVLGTQFPDLVDKPLAWTFGILPNGRSLTHSLLTAFLVITVLRVLVRHRHCTSVVTAFLIGYLSHLGGDALHPLSTGQYSSLGFLAWPVVPAFGYTTDQSIVAHFQAIELTSSVVFQVAFAVFAFGIWMRDGVPGVQLLVTLPQRAYQMLITNN